MKFRALFFLLAAFYSPVNSFAQIKQQKSSIHLATADAEGRVAISVTLDELPGQRFVLEIPELFTSKGLKGEHFNYSKQLWSYRADGADMSLSDDKYTYVIKLDKIETKKRLGLKWKISFKNNHTQPVEDLVAFNCWTMNFAPLFKDVEMRRTFVLDSAGNSVQLASVHKAQGLGRRSMQYYPVANSGVDLYESPWIRNWNVISDQKLSGKCISVLSTNSKWIFENKIKGKVAFFFNNFENDHGCVHASPLLSKCLKPGKTASAKGTFMFSRLEQ